MEKENVFKKEFLFMTAALVLSVCSPLPYLSPVGDTSAQQIETPTPPRLDGDYRGWHLPDGTIIRLGKGRLADPGRGVAYSPDSQLLAVASGVGIYLYDVMTSRELALLPTPSWTWSVMFSPDGTTLAIGTGNGPVRLWDIATGENIATLKYVAQKTGKKVVQLNQWLPTSKTCSACDTVKEDLELRDRTFRCDCGFVIDRDLNAAINIHRWGHPPLEEAT